MHACVKCGARWDTEWLAEPANCETCNPFPCERCDGRFPDPESAYLCCRD